MDKKEFSERDICTKFITPALTAAGWDLQTQIREEVALTNGKILVRGQSHRRGERKFADYILYYKPNIPLAVIEAKYIHALGDGAASPGLRYAGRLLMNYDQKITMTFSGCHFYLLMMDMIRLAEFEKVGLVKKLNHSLIHRKYILI